MTPCEVVYFKTERGDEPVREFVDALDIKKKTKQTPKQELSLAWQRMSVFLASPEKYGL